MNLTPELRKRFLAFREVYLAAEARMSGDDVQGAVIARRTWEEALAAVPLDREELILYKKLVAMHSVNGGELFGNESEPEVI